MNYEQRIKAFYKSRIEPFIALFILILLIVLVFNLVSYNKLQKQISKSCGFATKDYKCICKKSVFNSINKINPIIFKNVSFHS